MTVHGAKGLQAPIVILPDTMQPPGARGIGLFWDEDILLWPPRKADDEAIAGRLRAAGEARRLEEYRRLLYVAMTRAEDRLYVCGWPSRATAAAGNWYALVRDALAPVAEPAAFDGPWAGDALRLDTPQSGPAEREAADVAAVEEKPLPDWVRQDPLPEAAPPRPLAPSRPEIGEPAVISPLAGDGGGFRRGLLIHRLLELLPDLPPDRRAAACRQWLDRQAPDLDARVRSAIAAETLAVLDDPLFSMVFAPGSRAEVALTGLAGGRVVSGQIDRLAVTDGAVLVVDYKTNRSPPPTIDAVAPVYLRQMAAYRDLLAGIYPEKTITCGLLWTDGPGLMALPDALLDRHAP
jgi:ATP-dependent helicase/nuclease subunit A